MERPVVGPTSGGKLGRIGLYQAWLPGGRVESVERPRQAGGRCGGSAQRLLEQRDLSWFHFNFRLREPAHASAKGLLPKLEPTALGRLNQDNEEAFRRRLRRNFAKDRFHESQPGGMGLGREQTVQPEFSKLILRINLSYGLL